MNTRPSLQCEGLWGRGYTLFCQGQGLAGVGAACGVDVFLRERGLEVGSREAPVSWRKRLGWDEASLRWALVDRHGQVLLQGKTLPEGGTLLASYRALGLPTDLERLAAFRSEHPEHLGALALEAGVRGSMAQANAWERPAAPHPGGQTSMGEDEKLAWQAYGLVLERLLQDPLGTCPGLLRRAQISLPRREELEEDPADLKTLAVRILPHLEEALAKRPEAQDLWRVWQAFAAQVDRPLQPLLDTLAPSPMARPEAWPPPAVLLKASEELKRQGRWQALANLLQDPMLVDREDSRGLNAEVRRANARASRPWVLRKLLLEALLHLGRIREAGEILEARRPPGEFPGSCELKSLCQVAEDCGESSWAERWRSKTQDLQSAERVVAKGE